MSHIRSFMAGGAEFHRSTCTDLVMACQRCGQRRREATHANRCRRASPFTLTDEIYRAALLVGGFTHASGKIVRLTDGEDDGQSHTDGFGVAVAE